MRLYVSFSCDHQGFLIYMFCTIVSQKRWLWVKSMPLNIFRMSRSFSGCCRPDWIFAKKSLATVSDSTVIAKSSIWCRRKMGVLLTVPCYRQVLCKTHEKFRVLLVRILCIIVAQRRGDSECPWRAWGTSKTCPILISGRFRTFFPPCLERFINGDIEWCFWLGVSWQKHL